MVHSVNFHKGDFSDKNSKNKKSKLIETSMFLHLWCEFEFEILERLLSTGFLVYYISAHPVYFFTSMEALLTSLTHGMRDAGTLFPRLSTAAMGSNTGVTDTMVMLIIRICNATTIPGRSRTAF